MEVNSCAIIYVMKTSTFIRLGHRPWSFKADMTLKEINSYVIMYVKKAHIQFSQSQAFMSKKG